MEEISPDIFVETEYDGVNVGAILLRQGFICVDAPSYPNEARDWNTRLERRHPRGARFIFLTDCNGDRILNTRYFRAPIITQQYTADKLNSYEKRYPQYLLDSLIQRNPSFGRELTHSPVDRPSISFSDEMEIIGEDFNIKLYHVPGPTPGNAWLYIPAAGVLFTGDSVVVESNPPIAEICLLDWLESLKSVKDNFGNVKTLVPGRGPIGHIDAINVLVDFLSEIQNRIEMYIEAGKLRDELPELADELHDSFLSGSNAPIRHRNQFIHGLQRVYDQLIALKDEGQADEVDLESP